MGSHDEYGKRVLRAVAGSDLEHYGASVEVNYGAGQPARIDGAIAGTIAVEIESRTSKQVRGAVLDLICHPFRKKLLILLPVHMTPVHMTNPAVAATQCSVAMRRFLDDGEFEVIVLSGHGGSPVSVKVVGT